MRRALGLLGLALWAAFSRPARAGLLIATLAGGVAGVTLTLGVLSGYAAQLEAITFGSYARSLVINENSFVPDRFGRPRLADIPRLGDALGADMESHTAWRQTIADVRAGRNQANLPTFGVMGDYRGQADMPLAAGRLITVEESESAQRLCLLGAGAKRQLFEADDAVGRSIRLNGVSCEVVGVFGEAENQMAERYRQAVLTPFIAASRYFENDGLRAIGPGPQEADPLVITLREGVDRDAALITADRALRRAHGASQTNVSPFQYADPDAPLRALSRQRDLVARLLMAIAAVSVLVAGAGYAAASIAAVETRRREIALQMMSGATGRSILAQILVEGALLGAVGALAGLILVASGAQLAQLVARFPFALDPWVALGSVAGGAFIGIGASVWPAVRAASGSPVLAARS